MGELGNAVTEIGKGLQAPWFVIAEDIHAVPELSFYVAGQPQAYCSNLGWRRMPQYDLWPGFEKLVGYNGIYVTEGDVAMLPQAAVAFASCQKHYVVIDGRQYPGERLQRLRLPRIQRNEADSTVRLLAPASARVRSRK